jgi:hypothetical protein
MKYRESWELPTIPDESFYAELGRRRRQKGGGNPKKLRPCKFCAEQYGAREMIYHVPRCPKRVDARTVNTKETLVTS